MNCSKVDLIKRSKYYEMVWAVRFMKPRVGLIFFVIDNRLIVLLSIYVIIILFI